MKAIIDIFLVTQRTFRDIGLTIISILRVVLLSKKISSLPIKEKSICSILGNGPSLLSSFENDIDFLATTELVCVNKFVDSEYYEKLKPQNCVWLDPAFFNVEVTQRSDIYHSINELVDKTQWNLNLYIPQLARKALYFQKKISENSNIKVIYFNYTIFQGLKGLKHWFFERGLAMPQAQNVMVCSLYLMLRRRFESIYIFGGDHSWHEQLVLNEDNELIFQDVHFYDKNSVAFEKVPTIESDRRVRLCDQFVSISKAFFGYEELREYAKYLNVPVYNASKRSYIDAFPKIKLDRER